MDGLRDPPELLPMGILTVSWNCGAPNPEIVFFSPVKTRSLTWKFDLPNLLWMQCSSIFWSFLPPIKFSCREKIENNWDKGSELAWKTRCTTSSRSKFFLTFFQQVDEPIGIPVNQMITNERTLKKIVVMGSGVIIFARVPSSSAINFFCIGNDWPVAMSIRWTIIRTRALVAMIATSYKIGAKGRQCWALKLLGTLGISLFLEVFCVKYLRQNLVVNWSKFPSSENTRPAADEWKHQF